MLGRETPPAPRKHWIYREATDPAGHPVKKEELFDGSQKRSIFWCPAVQK
jgi:hypothetical protein